MSAGDFAAIEARHRDLVAALRAGGLTEEAFAVAAAELRLQDAEGAFWQLDPRTGLWLRWDGARWLEATPPAAAAAGGPETGRTVVLPAVPEAGQPGPVPGPAPTAGAEVGRTVVLPAVPEAAGPGPGSRPTPGLGPDVAASVKATTRSVLSQLPGMLLRQFLFRIPVITLTGLSVWALHTILLVWKNQGFNFQEPWGPYLNAIGGTAGMGSSAVIWGVPLALFWSAVISLFRCGPVATARALVLGPVTTFSLPFRGGTAAAGFCLGGGSALFLAMLFGLNRQAGAALTLTSLFLAAGYPGMLLARVVGDLWTRVFEPRTPARARRLHEVLRSVVVGLTPGFFLVAILPWFLKALAALGLLGAGFLLLATGRGTGPGSRPVPVAPAAPGGVAALVAWLLSTAAAVTLLDLVFGSVAHADDGGSNEIQGGDGTDRLTWTNVVAWWNSQGSGQAIGQGVPPAGGAVVGTGLVPPIAPPTGGLVIEDDVVRGSDSEEEGDYRYEVDVASQGAYLVPADGRTTREFYAIVRTNDPKWTPAEMMETVAFSFTAPTGFSLEPQKQFTSGGGTKHVEVVCVPPPDAAYAPGKIPGVAYASASSPLGGVRGHAQVQIEVGGGEMVLHPLDRTWVRGPVPSQPADSLTLFARLALPAYCVHVPDQERNAGLSLKTIGEFANYLYVNPPEDPEGWRSWRVGPNEQLQPEHLKGSPAVELGLEGRIMAGLLQQVFRIQVLPPPMVRFEPAEPFLVPEALTETEVVATVVGAGAGEEWQVEAPVFSSGDQDVVSAGSCEAQPPASAKVTFRLGHLPEDRDEASATFKVRAKLTKPVKDYVGPNETEEADLTVSVRRPGLILLTKMPVVIPSDGKTPAKFSLTVLNYTPGEGGKPGTLVVDEAMLKPKALTFATEVEAEGAAEAAFRGAAVQLTYGDVLGEGLHRRASYSVRGSAVVPGDGREQLGKLEISATAPPGAREEDYRKKLELGLGTVKVDGGDAGYPAARGKYKDYATEKKLFLKALDEMILRPYSTIQAMRGQMHILEWGTEWLQGFVAETPESSLQKLWDLHNELKEQLDRDPRRDASLVYQKRVELVERSRAAWAAVANAEGGIGDVMAGCQWVSEQAKWLSEAIFPKLMEIYLVSLGRSPRLADIGGSVAGWWQSKVFNEFAGNVSAAYAGGDPSPWQTGGTKTWNKLYEEAWPNLVDTLWGAVVDKTYEGMTDRPDVPGAFGTARALQVKIRLYFVFSVYKFFQHWLWDHKEDGTHKSVWEAFEDTGTDLAAKSLADTCEWLIGEVPKGKAGEAKSEVLRQLADKKEELRRFLHYLEFRGQGG